MISFRKKRLFICCFAFAFVCSCFLAFKTHKGYSENTVTTLDFALLTTEYTVKDADSVKEIIDPNGNPVLPDGDKLFLKTEGVYTIRYDNRDILLNALRDNPAVTYDFDSSLSESYCLGERISLPVPKITSILGEYPKFTLTIYVNRVKKDTVNNVVLKNYSLTLDETGEYTLVYSCTDEYTLGYTSYKILRFETKNESTLIFAELPSEIGYGESIKVGAVYALYDGKTYFAELKITSPSGKTETLNDIMYVPDEAGEYVFTATSVVNGETLTKEQRVTVKYYATSYLTDPFAIDEVKSYVDMPYYCKLAGTKSIFVKAQNDKSNIFYSRLIDLKEFDKNKPLIEFMPYSGGDSYNSNEIKITLIDAADASNTLTFQWWYNKLYSDETYLSTFVKGEEYGGISNEVVNGNLRLFYGTVAMGCRFNVVKNPSISCIFNIRYDREENAVYTLVKGDILTKVIDFDDTDYISYSKIWNGFSSDNVYLKIEFTKAQPVSAMYISSIGGNLCDEEILNNPKDDDCFCVYSENIPTETVVNAAFSIPDYVVNKLYSSADLEIKAFKQNEDVSYLIVGDAFVPRESGDYTISYRMHDVYGNLIVKDFYVHVHAEFEDMLFEPLSDDLKKANISDYYRIPDFVVTNGIGKVEFIKRVFCGNEFLTDAESFYISDYGDYKVVVTATDYIGREKTYEYNLILDTDYVSVIPEIYLRSVRAGSTINLPSFTAFDYSTMSQPQKRIDIYAGNEIIASLSEEPYGYTVPKNYGNLVFKYVAGDASVEMNIEVLPENLDSQTDFLILGENCESVMLKDGAVITQPANQNGDIVKFPNALPADNLKIIFGCDLSSFKELQTLKVRLTDAVYNDISVDFDIEGNDTVDATKKYAITVNNDGRVFKSTANLKRYSDDKTKQYLQFDLTYDNLLYKFCDSSGNEVANVITLLNGRKFEGFKSGLVYIDFYSDSGANTSAETKLIVYQIGNQKLTYIKDAATRYQDCDTMGPNIWFEQRISSTRLAKNSVLYLPAAKGYDTIQQTSSVTVEVKKLNGQVVLQGNIEQGRQITLTEFGVYIVDYTAVDARNKIYSMTFEISVYGDLKPEIVVARNIRSEYKQNDVLTVPDFIAYDKNNSDAPVSYSVYLRNPSGYLLKVNANDDIALTEKGTYYIICAATDDFYNVSSVKLKFTVN